MTRKHRSPPKPLDRLVAECSPSARAIAQCLRMLAEEADSLNMPVTRDALTRAMRACAAESHGAIGQADCHAPPPGTALH